MANSNSSSGIGVTGLLGVAFVVLKLTNVIEWSWWWVTSPFWIPLIIVLIVAVIYIAYQLFKINKQKQKLNDLIDMGRRPNTSRFQKRLNEMMEEAENHKSKSKP
ncbi:MAG: hypothetical protein CMD31_00105 [Flavobacteriales bacterium]|nr:hypothetical protein [Flavobacteriales bacterium]|tara:strand:- start:280 stop:594 length:315 start_codon:yes stop_codon:yes gene_type:complete